MDTPAHNGLPLQPGAPVLVVFQGARDVAVEELRIEQMFPDDAATEAAFAD